MPRGKPKYKKQSTVPDHAYNDVKITRFVNYVMENGKKDLARQIVYESLTSASEKLQQEDVSAMFEQIVENVRPSQEVRSRRVGGANYQVPTPVPKVRGEFLAMNWIIDAARGRSGSPMVERLTSELVNAYNNGGDAVTKKENTHKMAEANRAFAHFRW